MLRETQHGEVADGTAKTTPATSTPGPGNRALIARDGLFPQSTTDLHWTRQPDFQPSPGQVIIPGPVWRW